MWPALRWILYHVAALDLSLFVLPFAALIVLVANARHLDAPLRAFCGRGCDAHRLAHDRGRHLRLALVAADRGAEPLLRRAALPDRALRLDRARPAASRPRGRRGRGHRRRAARRDPVRRADEHQRAVGHAVPPAVVVSRRSRRRATATSRCSRCSRRSRSPRRSSGCRDATRRCCRWSSRSASCSPGSRSSSGSTRSRASRRPRTRPGISEPRALDRRRGRPQRRRDARLDSGNNPYRGWENEFWNRSVRHVYDLGANHAVDRRARASQASPSSRRPGVCSIRRRSRSTCSTSSPTRRRRSSARVVAEDAKRRWRSIASTASCARRRRSAAGTATPGPRRAVDWTRRACTRGVLRVPVHSDPTLFAGVTQQIAVSGHAPMPFVVDLPSTAHEDDRRPSAPARRRLSHPLRHHARARSRRQRPTRRSASSSRGSSTFRAVAVRIVVDVSPLSHPRTGVGNYIRGSLLGLAEVGGPRGRRVRTGEPARQADDRGRARRGSRSSAGCPCCRPRTRCAPRGAGSAARPRARRRPLRRLPLQRLDVPAAAVRRPLDDDPRPRARASSRSGCTRARAACTARSTATPRVRATS